MDQSSIQGTIFDIQRFSTHDGEGIRTNVFLKGCPLACVWCQNPEGIDPKIEPIWLPDKCIYCKACSDYAPDAISWDGDNLVINYAYQGDWSKIIEKCPTTALRFNAGKMTVLQLLTELKKDEVFYKFGGGVTFSGGEPLIQIDFLELALIASKQRGWNTAIETALNVSWSSIERVLPYVDTLFADFKIFDNHEHMKHTFVSNNLIKENIGHLLTSEFKDKAIIRTPLIPIYTATKENISMIAKYISKIYPEVKYELLNYNPLAISKYPFTNLTYCFSDMNPTAYTNEEMLYFQNLALESGIRNLVKI